MNLDNIMPEQAITFLHQYINNSAPTGHEWRGQQIWLDYLKPYIDTYEVDVYGTAYGIINPDSDYRVVLEAHADEIGWRVSNISEDGIISVMRLGGSDPQIAPSKRLNIHTSKNDMVKGVFGWPAIHLRGNGSDLTPKYENIFVDCGFTSRQEAEDLGIHIGCVATYEDELTVLQDRYYCGRAIDNRIGGFMIAQVARLLKENNIKLPFGLYIVNSVQEEVGLRGAEMISRRLKPHVAIITDVSHDTSTPGINKSKYGDYKCGKGPMIGYGPAIHNKLLNLIIEAAQENELPFQRESNGENTGTDTDAFAYSNEGVVSALISLPLRYMHTTVEMVHKDDIAQTIELMYRALQKIQYQHNFKYF